MGNTKHKDYKKLLSLYRLKNKIYEDTKIPISNIYYKIQFKPRDKFKSPELNRFLNWYSGYIKKFLPYNLQRFVYNEWDKEALEKNKQFEFKDLNHEYSFWDWKKSRQTIYHYLNKFRIDEIPVQYRKHFKPIYVNTIVSNWVNNDPFTGLKK